MTTIPAPPGAPTEARLTQRLLDTLQPMQLEVLDESWQHSGHVGANDSGQGTHFRVRISAEAFRGKSPLARHRLVYDALQDFLDQGLHALAIEASLPPA